MAQHDLKFLFFYKKKTYFFFCIIVEKSGAHRFCFIHQFMLFLADLQQRDDNFKVFSNTLVTNNKARK